MATEYTTATARRGGMMRGVMAENLYVHVPFCAGKCRYCAFRSEATAAERDVQDYLRLLPREIESRGLAASRPRTVYIGGGTPSFLGPDCIRRLLSLLPEPAPSAEITVECNPGDVSSEFAAALADAGATRVSLGIQSFSDRALRWLGRRHDAAQARAAFAMLRSAGFRNLSLDLIAALPGAPEGEFENSLREAVSLGPEHVSVYTLSVEPGTPLDRAGVRPAPDDSALAEISLAARILDGAGLRRYEISNYARAGHECRHNRAVWLGEDYSGIGPAAWSREGLSRRENGGAFAPWRDALAAGAPPPSQVSIVSEEDDRTERFIMRGRLAEFDGPVADDPDAPRHLAALRSLAAAGAVREIGGGRWALTERGFEVSDSILAALVC